MPFLHSKNELKMFKIQNLRITHPKVVNESNKHPFHHFGGILAWKSGLKFWIRALQNPFSGTWKWALFDILVHPTLHCNFTFPLSKVPPNEGPGTTTKKDENVVVSPSIEHQSHRPERQSRDNQIGIENMESMQSARCDEHEVSTNILFVLAKLKIEKDALDPYLS